MHTPREKLGLSGSYQFDRKREGQTERRCETARLVTL